MPELKEIVFGTENKDILCGISLNIVNKGIYGVLSTDRTATTALAEIICGCKDADGGEVLINGDKISRSAVQLRKKVRLVPSNLILESTVTPFEYLDFVGTALSVESEKKLRQIKEAMELVGMESMQNKPFSTLSASARCRLSIAAALIGNPECIVFDDSFGMLSETSLADIYEILRMLGTIKTLILFSHKPEEVKKLCENIAIMSGGKIVLSGNISDIEKKINATNELRITVRGDSQTILRTIPEVENVLDVKLCSSDKNNVHTFSVEHYPDTKIKDKLFAALSLINAPMLSVKEIKLTLSDVYYSFTINDSKEVKDEQDDKMQSKRRKKQ